MLGAIVERCNSFAQAWAWWLGMSILDAAIVLAFISLLWFVIRRKASPQLGYLLFLLVPIKLFVPIHVAVPERILAWTPLTAVRGIGQNSTPTAPPSAAFTANNSIDAPANSALKTAPDERFASQARSSLPVSPSLPPSGEKRASISISSWLMFAWCLGLGGLLVRLVNAQIRFHRSILRNAIAVESLRLSVDIGELLARLKLGRNIRIVESDRISSPVVWGIFRPTLILPAGIAATLSQKQLEWVLLHELAHVRRRDLAVNCFQRAAGILHFVNPSIWIANHAIDRFREYACDDLASAYGFVSQVESGEAFLGVMRYAASVQHRPETNLEGALGMFESTVRASCFKRMMRLLDANRRLSVKLRWGSICLLLLTAVLALPQIRAAGPKADDENANAAANAADKTEKKTEAKKGVDKAINNGQRFELTIQGPEGKPGPEAEVEFRGDPLPEAEVLQGKFLRKSKYGLFVQADAEGRLVLNILNKLKRFDLYIETRGYGPFRAEWDSEKRPDSIPEKFTAALDAAWSVGGMIVDDQGKPIEGVEISFYINVKKSPEDTREQRGGRPVNSDAEGKWQFNSVPASMQEVFVEISHPRFKPNRRTLTRSEFGISAGGKPTAKIEMLRGLTVSGKVADESGKPITDAVIRTKFTNDIREAKTNESGEYRLIGCEPAMAKLVVSAKGRATDMKEVRIGPDLDPVNFTMKPGGKVRIRVLDEKGNPAPHARIFFQYWRGRINYFEFDNIDQYADKDGVWQWNEAPLDEFKADICPPNGMQLVERSLIARDEEYVFRTYPVLEITGNVIDAETKEPIKSFRVIQGIRGYDEPNAQSGKTHVDWVRHESYAAKDGQYRAQQDRESIAHLVRIEADGYKVAVSRDIKSEEGTVKIDFALTKGKDIATTVLTPDGKPAAGAKIALGIAGSQINVTNGNIDDGSTYAARQETDATGKFHFSPQIDVYQLVITHPSGYAYFKSAEKELPDTLTLTPWARVEGTFCVGTKAMPNVTLEIMSSNIESYGNDVPHIFTHHKATTGVDGKYVFERVFPGKGRIGRNIVLMVNEGATEVASSCRIAADFPEGKTTHIDLGGSGRSVIGQLVLPADINEKPFWNLALIDIQIAPPKTLAKEPPVPADIRNDPKQSNAWMEQWRTTDAGKAWLKEYVVYQKARDAGPYIWATVDRDGSFRIDDVPPGEYVLSVRFSEHRVGHLADYRFEVPPLDADQPTPPLDLGSLALKKD